MILYYFNGAGPLPGVTSITKVLDAPALTFWKMNEVVQATIAGAERLASLPNLWAKTSDAGRHAIAEAVFERIEVLGVTDYTFTLTAHAKALGWDVAFGAGVVRVKEGQSGRGERDSRATNDLPITMRLSEPRTLHELVRSA